MHEPGELAAEEKGLYDLQSIAGGRDLTLHLSDYLINSVPVEAQAVPFVPSRRAILLGLLMAARQFEINPSLDVNAFKKYRVPEILVIFVERPYHKVE